MAGEGRFQAGACLPSSRWSRAAWSSLFAVTLLGIAVASVAEAAIYWDTGSISRANLDGSNAQPNYISNEGIARFDDIDVHGNFAYWADNYEQHRWIGRVRLDGAQFDPKFIVPGTEVLDVAVNDSGIYWTDGSTFGRIGRANLDGENVNTNFISTEPQHVIEFGLTASQTHIYWQGHENSFPGNATIGRANTDGSGVNPALISAPDDQFSPSSLALSAEHIFFLTSSGMGRARLDGTEANLDLVSDERGVCDVAVGGSALFWSTCEGNTIGRANLDGTSANRNFLADVTAGEAIATDERVIPNTEIIKGPNRRTAKRRAKITFRSSNAPNATFECALDKGKFKPCESPAVTKVDPGKHRFYVRAVNEAGADPSPARIKWTVKRT